MFFIAALSLSGIPPLSGFLGKVFITQGTFEVGYFWLGGIGLITSLMVLYSVMKIFMNVFWGDTYLSKDDGKRNNKRINVTYWVSYAVTIALGLGVEGIGAYVSLASEGLLNPTLYIEAVLGENPMS